LLIATLAVMPPAKAARATEARASYAAGKGRPGDRGQGLLQRFPIGVGIDAQLHGKRAFGPRPAHSRGNRAFLVGIVAGHGVGDVAEPRAHALCGLAHGFDRVGHQVDDRVDRRQGAFDQRIAEHAGPAHVVQCLEGLGLLDAGAQPIVADGLELAPFGLQSIGGHVAVVHGLRPDLVDLALHQLARHEFGRIEGHRRLDDRNVGRQRRPARGHKNQKQLEASKGVIDP
jgi:hypothetical protein